MSDRQSAEKELEKYKKQRVNMLGPSINLEELSQFHKIVFDSVTLSIGVEAGDVYKYKDAYKGKSSQYIITGSGLQKLAVVAGVRWDPKETKVTAISQRYVAYTAVGCIKRIDGTNACFKAESDIDIDVVLDEIEESFRLKKKKWAGDNWFQKLGANGQDDYVNAAKKKEENFRKKHKTKIAATDARSRVLRPLLMLKKTYTAEELKRPFVMARVILAPDYNDPTTRKMMLTAAIQAQTNLFGQSSPQLLEDSATIDIAPEDYKAVDQRENDARMPATERKEPATSEASHAEEKEQKTEQEADPELTDFKGLSEDEQIRELDKLSQAKDYDLDSLPTNISKMDSRNRERFFTHLAGMKTVEADIKRDIPF